MGIEHSGSDEGVSESEISAPTEKAGEKASERPSSKTLAKIAKARKDEAKGRRATSLLSGLLAKILKDPRFDPVLPPVLSLLRNDVPGGYVLGILSLVSTEAALAIRREFDPSAPAVREVPRETERKTFEAGNIRPDLKARINEWIEDVFRVSTNDPSAILTEKFLSGLSKTKEREIFLRAVAAVLVFFFDSKNVAIPEHEAEALSRYLVSELRKRLSELGLERVE